MCFDRNMRYQVAIGFIAFSAVAVAAIKVSHQEIHREKVGYYDAKANVPKFSGNALAALASKAARSDADSRIAEFMKDVKGMDKPTMPWTLECSSEISVAKDKLISFSILTYWYTGGAHPNREYSTMNFATMNGKSKRIGLADIMLVRMTPEALAWQLVQPKLKAMDASSVVDGSVKSLTREQCDNFVVTKNGLQWQFSPYEMGSYAEGEMMVDVPWSALKGKLNVPLIQSMIK